MNSNKLLLKIKKIKIKSFHQPKPRIRVLAIKINDIPVEYSERFNFLGITIDQHLNGKTLINKISNKIARSLSILNKLKHILPISDKIKICNSLILSHIIMESWYGDTIAVLF